MPRPREDRVLALTYLALLAQAGSVFSAPSPDLIGSLARAQYQCSVSASCLLPEEPTNPVQPELAAHCRKHWRVKSTEERGRRLKCQTVTNPVLHSDFPDPSQPIAGENGLLYAYATNSLGFNIQYATASPSALGSWTYANKDALPDGNGFPSWANSRGGYTWAPAVIQIGSTFHMYFTARSTSLGVQCIGHATSATAAGPFRDPSSGPFVCQPSLGGSIDPQPFQNADGTRYLLWAANGNNGGSLINRIFIQQMSADGTQMLGNATQLLTPSATWENTVTEAPFLEMCNGGKYCLYYSGYPYTSCNYAVGVAVATSLLGPYTKDASNPILKSNGAVCGPGGQSPFPQASAYSLIHTWNNASLQYRPLSLVGFHAAGAPSSSFDSPTSGSPSCQ